MIDFHPRYLQSFLAPGNLGDRLMIAAMARGLEALCGSEPLAESAMEVWVRTVAGSDNDRFLKMRTSRTPNDLVYDVAALPELRLPMPEDLARSRLDLARLAGYEGEPGPIPSSLAGNLLNSAVDAVWKRVAERLAGLSRESTVERALLNYVAACQEHRDWLLAMAPRLAVYDAAQIMDASTERITLRDIASLTSRVIAEMALCASPCSGGAACAEMDLDLPDRGGVDACRMRQPKRCIALRPRGSAAGYAPERLWTAPGLLDTRVRVFDLMRPPQLERVFPALPGPAFGSRSPRESNDGCTGS